MNKTLILYEKYVCLQFDIKAKRVNLQVVVNNSKLISHFLFLYYISILTIYGKRNIIHLHVQAYDCVGVAKLDKQT